MQAYWSEKQTKQTNINMYTLSELLTNMAGFQDLAENCPGNF